jgi:hypothetical protein
MEMSREPKGAVMKIRIALRAFCLAALSAVPASVYAQFEGVADFKVTFHGERSQGMQSSGKILASHGAYRSEWDMEIPARSGRDGRTPEPNRHIKLTMVGRGDDPDHAYMLDDENKTYSVMDLKKIREDSKDIASRETYTVQKQGSDTVAGISCQKATLTSSKGRVFDVCASKDWGVSADLVSALTRNQRSGSLFGALKDAGVEGFPVRFAMRPGKDAEPTMVWEVTRVERKTLPASLFAVPPPGYKQTDRAVSSLSPEQRKAIDDAKARMRENMTPEQRKAYEDAMRKHGQPTPNP